MLFNPTSKSGWNGNYRFIDNQNLVNANFSIEKKIRKLIWSILDIGLIKLECRLGKSVAELSIFIAIIQNKRLHFKPIYETKPKLVYKNFRKSIQTRSFYRLQNQRQKRRRRISKTFDATGTLQWEKQKTSIRGNLVSSIMISQETLSAL